MTNYLGPWADAPWDAQRWPDFTARELSCPHCGEMYVWPEALDAIQRLRDKMTVPPVINSGHRCAVWNALVGGAPLSQHKKLAFDVRLEGHDPWRLNMLAREAGFTGYGYGQTFLHLDTRPRAAHWFYGPASIAKWRALGLDFSRETSK